MTSSNAAHPEPVEGWFDKLTTSGLVEGECVSERGRSPLSNLVPLSWQERGTKGVRFNV